MSNYSYVALIPLLPLAAFVVLGLWGKKYLPKISGITGTLILLAITIFSFITAYQYFFIDGKVNEVYQPVIAAQYHWLQFTPDLSIDMGIVLDPISVMMLVVVSFVSLIISDM